jgi:hypothetical protein
VFSFVGGGDHLYAAGVSRLWRGRYLQYCARATTATHTTKCVTRHRSSIMSDSRLQHAKRSGLRITDLDMTQPKHAELICRYSLEPERVLTVLRLHGVPWDHVLCRKAAYFCRLRLLQWLHSNDCQWLEANVLMNASRGGSVDVLGWLQTVTKPWPQRVAAKMLNAAASCGELAAAQWLRAAGAAWPSSFASTFKEMTTGTCQQCWSVSAVQWAVEACGSGWLDWKCDDYAAEKYTAPYNKQQAALVFSWAHANGCPCTCGQQQQQQLEQEPQPQQQQQQLDDQQL